VEENSVIPLPELNPFPWPLMSEPLLINVPFAAAALPENPVWPPRASLTVPALFVKTPLPALELPTKTVAP
jgi:hypothetical protein